MQEIEARTEQENFCALHERGKGLKVSYQFAPIGHQSIVVEGFSCADTLDPMRIDGNIKPRAQ